MKQNQGFTLLELMIAVLVVSILTIIAIPAYNNYVVRSACDAGKSGLLAADTLINQNYLAYGVYNNELTNNTTFGVKQIPDQGTAYFKVTLENLTATTYTIKITPETPGVLAKKTGYMIINEKGEKEGSGSFVNVWSQGCSSI